MLNPRSVRGAGGALFISFAWAIACGGSSFTGTGGSNAGTAGVGGGASGSAGFASGASGGSGVGTAGSGVAGSGQGGSGVAGSGQGGSGVAGSGISGAGAQGGAGMGAQGGAAGSMAGQGGSAGSAGKAGAAGVGGVGGVGGVAGAAGSGLGGIGGAAGIAGGGSAGTFGDCNTPQDCNGNKCVALAPNGFRTCLTPVPPPAACGGTAQQCCEGMPCPTGQTCIPGPEEPSCGGGISIGNRCATDECASNTDCSAGMVCAPAGTLQRQAALCVPAPCVRNADCTQHGGGICASVTPTCCAGPQGLYCVYSGIGCRTNSDCKNNTVCTISTDGKSSQCTSASVACPP
jgi:hypothetical protein